ncbi:LCP family protein [Nonomuraea guangzhouensis]|uniref:LCP family protein n=1 Tax=Nonomuraea guangzhouensis TaxID=1291555 RepID=A0ABW4G9E8_9ACTN|nr:LCP family protein [Nonomuraea guangzhouensis]
MSKRDGVDTAPEGRKRRAPRRSGTASEAGTGNGSGTSPSGEETDADDGPQDDSPAEGPPAAGIHGTHPAGAHPTGPSGTGPGGTGPGGTGPSGTGPGEKAPGGKGPGGKAPGGKGSGGKGSGGTGAHGPASPGAGRPKPRPRPGSGAPQFAKPLTLGSVLGWTLLSAFAPGVAHLRAGRRRTGMIMLGIYVVLLAAGAAYGLTRNLSDLTVFAGANGQMTIIVVASVLALIWFAIIVTSYVALRPNRLNQQGQIISGIVVGVLCVSVMAPFALTASAVQTVRNASQKIFKPIAESTDDPSIAPVKEDDPWNGKDRVNFLLIGGDAAGDRTGVRTDSMTIASVDIQTGNTVLFSLPRNLQHVHFPPTSPLRKQFPNGFMAELPNGGLLNEVWQYATDNPQVMGGKNRGPRALMDAIGYTLNLKINYYAMMNMYGFADLVDAIGGLKIRVERDIKWGGHYGTAGVIKAGYKKLTGEQALWYGRSRVDSDDFSRMARQRCVIGAFAQQATPDKIILNFGKIADATKRLAQTNIPQELVEPLVGLAVKVKSAKITSLQFVPPEFLSGRPDWHKIRLAAAKAIADSTRTARTAQAADVTSSPGTPTVKPSRSYAAKPTQTPTQNSQKSAKSLSELCGL